MDGQYRASVRGRECCCFPEGAFQFFRHVFGTYTEQLTVVRERVYLYLALGSICVPRTEPLR
jgi:hypothetical protein